MRVYSREFRIEVVRRILDGEKVPDLSQELGIHRKLLYDWVRRVSEGGESNLRERGRPQKKPANAGAVDGGPRPTTELERVLSRQELIINFLKACLETSRDASLQKKEDWRASIFQTIEAMARHQDGLSVEAMCDLAQVTRSGYYRYLLTRATQGSTKGGQ